jgi:hypothetical protein
MDYRCAGRAQITLTFYFRVLVSIGFTSVPVAAPVRWLRWALERLER